LNLTIRLFATLRENRGKILDVEVSDGETIRTILGSMGIMEEDVAILLRNGRDASLDDFPEDKDTLSVFPPVGGG
jgi:molybdopterin converting factor small subunit